MSPLTPRTSTTGKPAETGQPGQPGQPGTNMPDAGKPVKPDAIKTSSSKPGAEMKHMAKKSPSGKPPTEKQVTGQNGEDQALAFLLEQGLSLVMRNFRCKMGEIDLIMRQRQTLVFVEVRKRAPSRYGNAADSINHAKQHKLLLAAQLYLQRFATPPACRFDVIAIDGGKLNWIQNAIEN